MGDYKEPNSRQRQICLDSHVDPDGMSVILENENALRLKHHKSGNIVSIIKGEAQRRKEQRGH